MKCNKRRIRSINVLVALLFLVSTFSIEAFASGTASIIQNNVSDETIELFISDVSVGGEYQAQIAMTEAEVLSIDEVESVHTIILIDNSLSITDANKEKIREIVSLYLEQKSEKEVFSVATYGEDIQYLAERESDLLNILDVLGKIEYQDRESFLTDILFDEIEKLSNSNEYTRFIVASDGVDNKAIGYTKVELEKKLEEKNYPIYALGCKYKNNDSELEDFFALSRYTKASYFLLDEYDAVEDIANSLVNDVVCVKLAVPNNLRDGSNKNILITYSYENDEIELKTDVSMPFGIAEIETVTESIVEPTSVEETIVETTVVAEPSSEIVEEIDTGFNVSSIITFLAIFVIFIAIVVLVVLMIVGNKKKNTAVIQQQPMGVPYVPPVQNAYATMPEEPVYDDEKTVFLVENDNKRILVLKDKNDASKVFRYPLVGKVVLGRKLENGVNILLNYNNTVSAKHCAISVSGGRFYVEDFGSSNKTYVNGNQVVDRREFRSGDVIRLGRLELIAEVIEN